MLSKGQFEVVLLALTLRRKNRPRPPEEKTDETDLHDVIEVLEEGSFAIVSIGSIDAAKKALEEINGKLKEKLEEKSGEASAGAM